MSDTLTPYYADEFVTLYHGDCRRILPLLDDHFDLAVTDPPYGETSLAWDHWPDGWVGWVSTVTSSMWCFGSMRMFLDRRDDFDGWRFSQDVIWRKQAGTGFASDRFKRVHEIATHWYRGEWRDIYHDAPTEPASGPNKGRTINRGPTVHYGKQGQVGWVDEGRRILHSVLRVRNMHGRALHPTEKPSGILEPLISYGCPDGGFVLDPFAGSGSTGAAAKALGRHAVLIEADERYCEIAAKRLAQDVLPFEEAGC